jgi:hypothetical protein
MQLARPRHARPVLGSYLNARSKRDLTTRPVFEETAPVEIFEPAAVPAGPTVGRAWELDTFTAPVRGHVLGAKEKFGIVVTVVGLSVLAWLMLRPVPLRADTREFISLAATAPIVPDETAAGFAKEFLTTLGGEWSPRVFFQNVGPAFWPTSPTGANTLAAHYTQGFDLLREHGRVLGVDILASRAKSGALAAATALTLPCTLEFFDGTALRGSIRVARDPESLRWSVVTLSILPVLP